MLRISPYLLRMREKTEPNSSEYGYLLRSVPWKVFFQEISKEKMDQENFHYNFLAYLVSEISKTL